MSDMVPIDAVEEVADPQSPASRRPKIIVLSAQDAALRLRMRRQAQLMILVAFLMLIAAFSVPFVLHYLDIKIP